MDAFEDANLVSFEDYMVQHLNEFAQRHSQILGEDGVRQVIKLGVERAAAYGMTLRRSVRLYIELMFILGGSCDTDPQLPWIGEILGNQEFEDEKIRTDKLYAASVEYHDKVIGDDSKYAQNAVRGIREHVETVYLLPDENFSDQILQYMQKIYPQKYEHTDNDGIQLLISQARQHAESFMATSHRAIALFATLMFGFGHGCHDDPLYPWISGTLKNDKAINDPNERVDRLFKKTKMYLDQMLNYLETG